MDVETTDSQKPATTRQALKTPRAAAIAGIIFSVLLSVSLALIRSAISSGANDAGAWAADPTLRNEVVIALNLIPFAGIAFLWFIGVVRDRMGPYEDRFFASVFLGSGLLFVAMLFAATSVGGGLIAAYGDVSGGLSDDVWRLGRGITYALMSTYAMRMAAVFTIATATITLRIAIMPRWMAIVGYLSGIVLLLGSGFVAWLELVFPAWVLLVSVYILIGGLRARETPLTEAPPKGMP